MFYHNKVVLLGEKIEIENFKEFEVVGIVCGGGRRRKENCRFIHMIT